MPIEKLDEATYRAYDRICALTMQKLWEAAGNERVIRLSGFDRSNKEHLFVFRMALMARALWEYGVEIKSSWWETFCINWKIRKGFERVKRIKDAFVTGIEVQELVDQIYVETSVKGLHHDLGEIYKAYYEGSCD